MNSESAFCALGVLEMYSKNVFCILQCTFEVHKKAVLCTSNNSIVLQECSAFLDFFICSPRTFTVSSIFLRSKVKTESHPVIKNLIDVLMSLNNFNWKCRKMRGLKPGNDKSPTGFTTQTSQA